MSIQDIREAVIRVTGCNAQFRADNKIDLQIKPLVLAIGMMRLHGHEDDLIQDVMNVENEESYKRMVAMFDEWLYLGAIEKDQPIAKRAFRQIVLIQTWLLLNRSDWVPTEKFVKF